MKTSGHKIQYGVDTLTNPALIRDRVLSIDSVNRTYRGGLNDTRPPFQLLSLVFRNQGEQELFENGSLTGLKGYNGIAPYTRSHIVATVGKHVFVGQIIGTTCYMRSIYDGLDDRYLHQFFVQGETILVINDGKNEGVFWNGQVDNMRKISESAWINNNRPMPIGNISAYAHGRFWILTEDGILYAGDHLYSQGNAASDEVLLSFSESAYPSSGDGFTATSEWGEARALAIVPRDPSTNGHGEVICFHEYGAYSVYPIDDRNKWTTENIQQTVIAGIGACSPWSVATINNDLFFRRSDNNISSLRDAVSQKTSNIQIRSLGGEVSKYANLDSDSTLRFTMSGKDDERVFFSVNHSVEDNKVLGGKHRYSNGLIVLDLYPGTTSSPDQISWDGLWTGPRVTGIAEIGFGSKKQAIFSSYDTDGKNRLYIIRRFRGDDILSEGTRRIVSMYSIGGLFDGIGADTANLPVVSSLSGSILLYSDAVETATVSADFRVGYSQNWFTLYKPQEIGLNPSDNSLFFDVQSGQFNSGGVASSCSVTEKRPKIVGTPFDLRTKIEGSVIIRANLLLADQSEMSPSKTTSCAGDSEMVDDEYNLFTYQF